MARRIDFDVAVKQYAQLVLDTSVLINEFKRRSSLLPLIPRAARRTLVVALWEFLRGEDAPLPQNERDARNDWLDDAGITAVGFSGFFPTQFRNLLRIRECPPDLGDALLAADCVARHVPLVTGNARDFDAVPGLHLVAV